MESSLNQIDVYQRLAYLERICDDIESARDLSFDDLYSRWQSANFFKELIELGFLQVSYNGNPIIDFIPNAAYANRHQALALSCFLASHYANSNALVSAPHERSSVFTATFTRISNNCIEYINDYGSWVQFTFDSRRPSQFCKDNKKIN
jgi:hypothetical protein